MSQTIVRSVVAPLALALATVARAAPPATRPAAAVLQDMRAFATTGRVLMVAAHPDDENTQLITYLARGRRYATAYLSVTRGDGGQNVLGGEFGDELGWIRTQELLAARRLDGGRQFFTRARDFGFSKSPAETLKFWDEPAVLGDVVRVIRTFRPDVIVTRFGPTQTNTHGHHTASAILALKAFKLAADPAAYPEQLRTLSVWQAKRIVQNAGGFGGGGNGKVRMEVGGQDPVLGLSYGQIAARSRAMHQSQGFANYALNGGAGGQRTETFAPLAGDEAASDLMDGVDTTWGRVPGGGPVGEQIDHAIASFNPDDPGASVPALVAIKRTLATLPGGPLVDEKTRLLDGIVQHCLGLTVETTTPTAEVTPGAELPLEHRVTIGAATPVRLTRITAAAATVDDTPADLVAGRPLVRRMTVTLPADAPLTQPYWLRDPAAVGLYAVADPDLIGRPENPPAVPVTFTFDVGGQTITVPAEPRGPDDRRLEIVAPVSLAFPFAVDLFKPGVPRPVTVEATARGAARTGTVRLAVPAGWAVDPAERPFTAAAGQTRTAPFTVTPPPTAATADLLASVVVGGKTYDTGYAPIRYRHIPPLLLQPRATLRAVGLDLATAGHTVGYLPGAGDSVADCLRQMGYAVTTLAADDLDAEKLKRFDTVVVGVRAFNVRPELATKGQALFDYAAAGGTVVEQYNRPDNLHGPLGPYPLKLSGSRITDETATMTPLAPDHPALTRPNEITPADFADWVQERGIYFPAQWDQRWTPLLGGSDPGEPRLDGGLLVARCGKGWYVYTGLAFFRQLPAGVPGAYRLFANLVSLGKP